MFMIYPLLHFLLFVHVMLRVVQADEILVEIGLPDAEMVSEVEFLGREVASAPSGNGFAVDPPVGILGTEVHFQSFFKEETPPKILYQRWEYGDGQWSNGSKVSHSYAKAGTYLVTLFAVDEQGHGSAYTQLYSVQGKNPCESQGDCSSVEEVAPSDWDLYMMRLVNRARKDPGGEAGRLGSSVVDSKNPVPPLAYHEIVSAVATNHTLWMHDSFGLIASGRVPDSLSHFETLDGTSNGQPASATPNYTGVTPGARLTGAGFPWNTYGENIQANYASYPIPISKSRIEACHRNWWESSGHRANMLNSNFSVFGFYVESRFFIPTRGGVTTPFSNIMFATQNFGRPQLAPQTYVFGVLYVDRDGNNAWTARDIGDPLREGLGNVPIEIYHRSTSTIYTRGKSMSNGAFSIPVDEGTYDIVFHPQGRTVIAENIVVSGVNVDIGDLY